ncbi:MAG: ComF family protein [Ktedonobacteraceae bacterium]
MNTQAALRLTRRIARQALDGIFPPRCAGCRASGHILCAACAARVEPITPPFCQLCGMPLLVPGLCQGCKFRPPALSGLRVMAQYQEPLRTCIHALKYDGNTRLAEPLGLLLAQGYRNYGLQADAIIAVPLHHERERQRGYNHARLLAEVCAANIGITLYNDLLIRHRATSAQVGLQTRERYQNVAGAFMCTPASATGALCGRNMLIIDDVCTTGATLEACAEPLFAAGAATVWGLVLARP